MSSNRYKSVSQKGHLEKVNRVVGYIDKMKHNIIRFRTKLSDYSDISHTKHDCETLIYGNAMKALPHDQPDGLGNHVIPTHYVDTYLYHNLITGWPVLGILHFLNQIHIE